MMMQVNVGPLPYGQMQANEPVGPDLNRIQESLSKARTVLAEHVGAIHRIADAMFGCLPPCPVANESGAASIGLINDIHGNCASLHSELADLDMAIQRFARLL